MDEKSTKAGSEWIRAETVCETLLEVSVKTIYRWAQTDPTMPVLRLRGRRRGVVLFQRDRLRAWLRQREQGKATSDTGRPHGLTTPNVDLR